MNYKSKRAGFECFSLVKFVSEMNLELISDLCFCCNSLQFAVASVKDDYLGVIGRAA